MNRLRDESGLDPISEKGIEMLRSVRPTSSSPLLKRRVWAALQESTIASPVRQRSSMLRVLVVGVGLVAFTRRPPLPRSAAGESRRGSRSSWGPASAVGATQPRPERTKPVRVVAESPRAPDVEMLPEVAAPEAPVKAESRTPVAASPPASPARSALRTVEARSTRGGDDAGARAGLGGAGCAPARSRPESRRRLLSHELEANPHGVLRQEALVLAIEAADARGDRRGAESFARAYQREFPSGRFKQLAQRYLDEKNARVRALPSNP